MNLADQLQKLQSLREQGALTEEEFTQAKKRLIDGLDGDGSTAGTQQAAPPRQPNPLQQLHRSIGDRWIGGVCGGLAQLSNMPAWSWRILFLLTLLLNGLGLVIYLLMWIFVPQERAGTTPARDAMG